MDDRTWTNHNAKDMITTVKTLQEVSTEVGLKENLGKHATNGNKCDDDERTKKISRGKMS